MVGCRSFRLLVSWAGAALALTLLAQPARAGPPYVSDDPEPTDYGHFEIYAFNNGTATRDGAAGESGRAGERGALWRQLPSSVRVVRSEAVAFAAISMGYRDPLQHKVHFEPKSTF
jgi:hypothetical protein